MKEKPNFTKKNIIQAIGVMVFLLSLIFFLAPFTKLFPITFGMVYLFGYAFYYYSLVLFAAVLAGVYLGNHFITYGIRVG